MTKTKIIICAVISAIVSTFSSFGQEFTVLPSDPNITRGTLPNGVSYYVVTNKSYKGLAEFALVQKCGFSTEDFLGQATEIARTAVSELPHFNGRNAREFLVSNGNFVSEGVPVSRSGIIRVNDNSTVYRFGKLPLSRGESAVDSTLLMIFDIINGPESRKDDYFVRNYPTSSNAVIVSGDIDKDAIVRKLKMLSLMVNKRPVSDVEVSEYKWEPKDSVICNVTESNFARYSVVTVRYSSPRVPQQFMSSVLPVVSERLGDILGTVLKKRLYAEMKRNNVPVGRIAYRYLKSTKQPGDECYEISVFTDKSNVSNVIRVMSATLAELDNKGTLPRECMDAKNEYLMGLYVQGNMPKSNSEYIDKCISSFLYGADLSSEVEKFKFFAQGNVSDTTFTRMFNNFASGLIDSTANLTINVRGDSIGMAGDSIVEIFESAWREKTKEEVLTSYAVNQNDSLGMKTSAGKIKVTSTKKESVSGGTIWTFENGMKVVYKRMNTGGMFYYNLAIRGGYSTIPNIRKGEGAFLSDVLETYDIAGLKSESFNYLMFSNGITMSSKVGISSTQLYGSAPAPSLTLMLKSLMSVAYERSIRPSAFDYYRQCEMVNMEANKGTLLDRIAAIDDLMCPSYDYSSEKRLSGLYPDSHEKAMSFFDEQFARCNDGVLVIVGDREETAMRKFLQLHIGGFKTQVHNEAKIKLPYQVVSGWRTITEEGKMPSADVAMSTSLQFSADNYFASKIVVLAIEDAVNEALCGSGTSVSVSGNLLSYPQERLSVLISTERAFLSGMPADEVQDDILLVLSKVRSAIASLATEPVKAGKLKSYKEIVKDRIASEQQTPNYWISVVTTRFIDGKDLNTKYADKINAVSADQVKEIIASLDSGSKVEYVVTQSPDEII